MTEAIGGNSVAALRGFVERIERCIEERKAINEDIKEIKAEAKGAGFDPAIIMMAIKIRAMDPEAREEREAAVSMYMQALGMAEAGGEE